jgi:crossover junction endodeoxyribonuclease RuvC
MIYTERALSPTLITAGVDVGCSGAIAIFKGEELHVIFDMPTTKIKRGKSLKKEINGDQLFEILQKHQVNFAFLEQVGGITGQSASAAFNFGRAVGAVEYAFKMYGTKVFTVAPRIWKATFDLINQDKTASRDKAKEIFPIFNDKFMRKKDDGRAEAVLIGVHGIKTIKSSALIEDTENASL